MSAVKIALIGAGSRSFGPATIRDVLLSQPLAERGVELVLMDKVAAHLEEVAQYAGHVCRQLGHAARVQATTELERALEGADYAVTAIEVQRFLYWTQDYHLPRHYGFKQIFGENGGPGSLFHALRNMGPTIQIARAMERLCPQALLLNYTNPEHKLCEAVTRLTSIQAVGLCHGVFMGQRQLAQILAVPQEELDTAACGINHFTFFQKIRHRGTGEDLYPRLRQVDLEGDEMAHWHDFGLGRVLLRRFGLWPSPGTNHYGEYIRWAEEFMASELQWYYDPGQGHPWETGKIPDFVYTIDRVATDRPWRRPEPQPRQLEELPLKASGELAAPIMEGLSCGVPRELDAVNVPNRGFIPELPEGLVVEVPARADGSGLHPCQMAPLPEGIAALIRTQASIHKLLVEAFAEGSKAKLLQALLLDPMVDSYRRAVALMEEMLRLQRDILPPLE